MPKVYEAVPVDGVELVHTFRGYNDEVEVYTFQADSVTYNLYKKEGEPEWHADWVTSYHIEPIALDADPRNTQAMLKAFAAMLKAKGVA